MIARGYEKTLSEVPKPIIVVCVSTLKDDASSIERKLFSLSEDGDITELIGSDRVIKNKRLPLLNLDELFIPAKIYQFNARRKPEVATIARESLVGRRRFNFEQMGRYSRLQDVPQTEVSVTSVAPPIEKGRMFDRER